MHSWVPFVTYMTSASSCGYQRDPDYQRVGAYGGALLADPETEVVAPEQRRRATDPISEPVAASGDSWCPVVAQTGPRKE